MIAAARYGHSAVVTVLCDLGANIESTTKSVSVYLYIHIRVSTKFYLSRYQCIFIEQYLCLYEDVCNFLVNIAASKGNTALREATGEGEVEVVKILLGRGAQIDSLSMVVID